MARETKQERLVRGMQESMAEFLHELKELSVNSSTKEADVERWAQGLLKSALGFTSTHGYSVKAQEARGKARPDLVVYKGESPVLVVEIKKLGFDLDKSDFRSGKTQLAQYLSQIGTVRWGILCNGFEWRLFDFSQIEVGGVEVLAIDLRTDEDQIDLSKKFVDEVCWDFVDFHENAYSNEEWNEFSKEATAFSPESLARAMLSADVLKLVARLIRGEHEFKANIEILTDRVFDLLNNGLDDSVTAWNETKQAELQKYVKSQKRASRRKKRSGKKDEGSNGDLPVDVGIGLAAPVNVVEVDKKSA